MRIGILETGTPPGNLADVHGRYDTMVRDMLDARHDYTSFRVFADELPTKAGAFDAFVITGSSAGVHDGLAWIEELAAFLRAARGRAKLVGLCFGHQIMAHAFGGVVARAAGGWGLGLHRYALRDRRDWMGEAESVAVMASHQDQVVVPPPGSTVIGASDFTPNAMIDHGDGAISFQCHPEFRMSFARALIDMDRAPDLTAVHRAAARRSLEEGSDAAIVGGWIDRFLTA